VTGSFKQSNEPSVSVKGGEVVYQLSDYQLLKHSAIWTWFEFVKKVCHCVPLVNIA
jgi:hypothetical protein